jgi:predicted AlkP superfamily pyrophosphatase or phosphodiesterase
MKNKHLAVINVVGLTAKLISKEHTPYIYSLLNQEENNEEELALKSIQGVFPAVTTTAQSAMLTGKEASEHGIVGNGWYFKDLAEVGFWKQSNAIVESPKIWEVLKARDNSFTCANSFWWYNMYSSVDYSMTPRPHYPADGSKILDLYSSPKQFHYDIEKDIGKFPFFNFWGPKAGIASSKWIANAAIKVQQQYMPNLHLIYLPHLDYNLQRLGPNDPKIAQDLREIDQVVKKLCLEFKTLKTEFMIVSEYGITSVEQPIHINKELRKKGYITIRNTFDYELLDCGASEAFAVADHQIAHIYVKDNNKLSQLKAELEQIPGVESVLDEQSKITHGIDHSRAGDLILIAKKNAWFTYYYWLDDNKAPDFARTIDIHRKPGYDPVEMFLDPNKKFMSLRIISKILKKKLGFRMLLDIIPLKPELVKGSHGRLSKDKEDWPIVIGQSELIKESKYLTDVYQIIKRYFE